MSKFNKIYHRALCSVGDSLYKKECPFCGQGVFLVGRNRDTAKLEKFDRCISCGMKVEWLDIKEMRDVLG